ncbi:hypothetical protein ACFS07_10980 [Undibacterium arcticum]
MKVVSYNAFARSDAMMEMVRAYVCNDGTGALMALKDFPSDTQMTFTIFKFYSCDNRALNGQRVVDMNIFFCKKDLKFVRDDLRQLSLEDKLNEINKQLVALNGIQLSSLKALLAIEKYVAQTFYDSRIASLSTQSAQIQAAAGSTNLLQVAGAIAGTVSGISELTTGLTAFQALTKNAPSSDFGLLKDYFVDKSADFKKSGDNMSNGFFISR